MSHEVETLAYVGATPWHKLGVKLEGSPTTEEAIKAAGLNWEVELQDLFTATGTKVDRRAVTRTTDGSVLGTVGTTYNPLQNQNAFEFFDPFLQNNQAKIDCAGSLRGGRRVFILAKIDRPDAVIVPQADDRISKYILLANSHDGTFATRIGFTPIRVVCANTLQMAMGSANAGKLLRVRHSQNNVAALEALHGAINLADQAFEATAEVYRKLAQTALHVDDLERYVRKVISPDAEPERTSRAYESIIQAFEGGRGNDLPGVKGTLWAAYNAVTEYVAHERGTDDDRRLDASWFGSGALLNTRALTEAMALAA